MGAQPPAGAYDELARRGVTLVVDLRRGTAADPCRDDQNRLAALGIAYERVPVHDGWVPSSSDLERILGLIETTDGRVFVHCGGGVGRSGCVAAAYARSRRDRLDVRQTFGGGVPSLEQLWFARRGGRVPRPIEALSRALDAPRQLWSWARGRLG